MFKDESRTLRQAFARGSVLDANGLLLRTMDEGSIIRKPYPLLYINVVVPQLRFLNCNPVK